TKDPPFSTLDLITCRNLLIYFGPVLQKKVMKLFHYALKPSGFLVLGTSETVGNAADLFTPLDRTHKIYTRKPASSPMALDLNDYEERSTHPPAVPRAAPEAPDLQKRMDQTLLSRFTPPAVLVSRDFRVL